ncbi:MAG: hypothetical protein ABIC19_00720 [Patescibacteria group bacterium]|nr:hypothetical protein [Patescibacteria group bacterium]
MSCYCHTCKKSFHSLGIARHRAAHRDKKEYCKITFSAGDTYEWDYSSKNKIKLPCLYCSKKYDFDEDSNEAKGILNVFCPGGDCEDRYALNQ